MDNLIHCNVYKNIFVASHPPLRALRYMPVITLFIYQLCQYDVKNHIKDHKIYYDCSPIY